MYFKKHKISRILYNYQVLKINSNFNLTECSYENSELFQGFHLICIFVNIVFTMEKKVYKIRVHGKCTMIEK